MIIIFFVFFAEHSRVMTINSSMPARCQPGRVNGGQWFNLFVFFNESLSSPLAYLWIIGCQLLYSDHYKQRFILFFSVREDLKLMMSS